jgi:hypothetical protein
MLSLHVRLTSLGFNVLMKSLDAECLEDGLLKSYPDFLSLVQRNLAITSSFIPSVVLVEILSAKLGKL